MKQTISVGRRHLYTSLVVSTEMNREGSKGASVSHCAMFVDRVSPFQLNCSSVASRYNFDCTSSQAIV